MKKALPIGVDNFKDLIDTDYYYSDKTLFIKELLDLKGKVNLFTRPRRFGKTLNLSMLRYFFEDTGNAEENAQNRKLFDGLKIMEAGERYIGHMGQYPVINLTLKSAKQENYETAVAMLQDVFAVEFRRHWHVIERGRDLLPQEDYESYAENSLYIILFSQITGLLQSIVTQTVPVFAVGTLLVMVAGGIGGGVCGRAVTKKMKDETVDRLFIGLMILMIAINAYNIVKFL